MMGFGIVSPILPLYARSFGVSLDAVGLLIAAFSVTRLAVDPFTGLIIDRLGERAAVVVGAMVVGATTALAAVAPTFPLLVVFRGAGGAGSAVFFAGLLSFLLRAVPGDRVGRVMSVWYASFNVGIIAGEPFGGVLADWLDPASTLWVYAGACFVAAAVFSRTIPDVRRDERPKARPGGLRHLRFDRPFVAVLLANGAYAWMIAGVYSTLIPLFGHEIVRLSPVGIGIGLAIASVTEFAVLFPAGAATDRIGRKAVIVPSYVLLAASLVLWPLASTPAGYMVGLGIFGLITGYSGVPQAAMLSDLTTEDTQRSAVAAFRFVGDLGFVLGPLVAASRRTSWGTGRPSPSPPSRSWSRWCCSCRSQRRSVAFRRPGRPPGCDRCRPAVAPVRVSARAALPVPAEEAWRRVLAWEEQVAWIKDADSVRVITSHREGVGVIVAVRTRVLGVPLLTDHLEVTMWDPPRRLVMAHRGLVRGVGEWLLEPAGRGARFSWTEELHLPVPVLGELALLAYRPFLRRLMRRSLTNLERLLREEA
jgi:predicted MFS family arabinose efflux permease